MIKMKHCKWSEVDTIWLLSSALNFTVKEFNQAGENGGKNYDSFNVAKLHHHITCDAIELINEIPTVLICYLVN